MIATGRFFRQPSVHQEHGNTLGLCLQNKIWPDLSLHKNQCARLNVRQEAPNREGEIVGGIAVLNTIAQKARDLLTTGWGHGGNQKGIRRRTAFGQFANNRRRSNALSRRNGMKPQSIWGNRLTVKTKTFAPARSVSRVSSASPPKAQNDKGQSEPKQTPV